MALPTNTGAFIHNGVNCTPNVIQTAQGVPYDNTSSGLSATNVQGAINEVYTCCVPLVYGTQTATTSNWTGELNVSTLYDGLTITYYLPYDSDGNVSLNLTLANGSTTGSKPVYLQIGKRLSTQYSAGATILITYYSAGSISKSGTPTDADMWICNAESMQVQQLYLPNPPDAPYPVLFGVGLSVGNIFGPTVKDIYNLNYNPKTTTLTATKFSGDISGCTGLSGASVSYSNTNSGLVATDVQGAVDEVNTTVSGITSHQQLYSYRLTNVGSNVTIRMTVPASVEFLIHIIGSVANGGAFYNTTLTGTSVSSGTATIYAKNYGSSSLGSVIITNTRIKFTVTGYTQLQIVSLHKLTNIEATVS